MKPEEVKKVVREKYGSIAKQQSSCCQPTTSCCCGGNDASSISKFIGYSENDLVAVPDGANLGLGCGNPIALAKLCSISAPALGSIAFSLPKKWVIQAK